MKILFVFTGGTIGSEYNGDVIGLNSDTPYALLDAYSKKYSVDFDYCVAKPYSTLSEYNSGRELSLLVSAISNAENCDGIIIAHGTDTLQYTAAALGYFFGSNCTPICLVSSNYPLSDGRANGLSNLHAAISLIKSKSERGVFVPYKNSDAEKTEIHRATRLLAHDAFSDSLRSVKGRSYGYVDSKGIFLKNPEFSESHDLLSAPIVKELASTAEGILRISACVGMTYPSLEGVKYILIDSYHSGTVDTQSKQAREFYLSASERGIKTFLSGAYQGAQYQSVKEFEALSIIPICDIAPISLYIKLWLYSQRETVDKNLLLSSRGGDIC